MSYPLSHFYLFKIENCAIMAYFDVHFVGGQASRLVNVPQAERVLAISVRQTGEKQRLGVGGDVNFRDILCVAEKTPQ